jgi:SAM-dependent methyltransferase
MSDQVAYWNGLSGERWVHEQTVRDAMLRPFGDAALHAAAIAPSERVLDVGCGCGDTTVTLAGQVGPSGRVLGLDVSAPMLTRAHERCAGFANITLAEGDAARAPLPHQAFDLLYSRFGVMFFAEPATAFAHMRAALKPGARAAFVCWRSASENPWAAVPVRAAAQVLGPAEPEPPEAPGPFAFGDAERVHMVLGSAGFREVKVNSFEGTMGFGVSNSLDEIARAIVRLGPVSRLLADRDEATVERVIAAIKAILPPYVRPDGGAHFAAAAWIVTAKN